LLESAFYQAKIDGIKLLEIGEDVWANEYFYSNDISALIDAFLNTKSNISPDIELRFQIGISAAYSPKVMDYLKEKHIRLNICPTSNIKLGSVKSYEEHPIRKLYLSGIDVTINSDDALIFDSDVSKEYLRLYQSKVLTAEQLDTIRINGLRLF
jgi:adenosine deaminase